MLRMLLLSALMFFCATAVAVPDKDLWEYWDQEDKTSKEVIDHSLWQSFLDKYVKYSDHNKMYMVTYSKIKKVDKDNLQKYLDAMALLDPKTLRRNEQLAYWINLYNALTVGLILKYYPVKSITKLGKGWFRTGPWKDNIIRINRKNISLHDIEHRILRPIWNNPKIHYALNCASLGCPDLAPQTYNSKNIDEQLLKAGNRFINQPKGVNFVAGRLMLSRIFDWYEDDFGGEKGVKKELLEHSQGAIKNRIKFYKGRISYRYNWQLNEY